MKKRIEVRSQAEFDVCVAAGNIAIVIGCHVVAWENSSVVAWENSSVVAWENSSVVAWENSSVEARENSSVEARENSSVVAWENSSVVARENSSVVARENSSVVARENSSVVARESVFVRLFSALKIKASAHVVVMKHGDAKDIKGGIHVDPAPAPVTGAEWCEYYGIDRDDCAFAVPSIDTAVLDIVQRSGGLDMGSWHGESCNEENWCSTTHCRAGAAICAAGKAGFDLERKYDPETAGRMIYAASRPNKSIPDFHASNEDAMADIIACASADTPPTLKEGEKT